MFGDFGKLPMFLSTVTTDFATSDLIKQQLQLPDEAATHAFGQHLASTLLGNETIFLSGDVGTGKTTLARGILRGLGVEGTIRSPTYTFIETYEDSRGASILHFDLDRLLAPEDLEFLAGRDVWDRSAIKLVEWPANALAYLPSPDLCLTLALSDLGGRKLVFTPNSQVPFKGSPEAQDLQ